MPDPDPDPVPTPVHLIPTPEIDADALTRDRTAIDAEAMAELQASILANGLRQPVELYAFEDPAPSRTGPTQLYGLISGHRRLLAVRALHALTGANRFAAIPAFLREPASIEAALLAMVEENEIRAEISAWERGRVAVTARDRGTFATIEEAVEKLFPAASRQKRARLRQFATVVEEFDGLLAAPEKLGVRNTLRLANACRLGYADLIRAALAAAGQGDRAAQWDLVEPILREADDPNLNDPSAPPGRPRRVSTPRHALTIRRERTRHGYNLHFTGRGATSLLMDAVFDEIDRIFAPC